MEAGPIDAIRKISIADIKRVDIALEGNWNRTVTTVWDRKKGFGGFSKVKKQHARYKPSVELYFPDYWVGIHCYKRLKGRNVFDARLALRIIKYIDRRLDRTA
jgi:hypothetical protein